MTWVRPFLRDGRNRVALMRHWLPFDFTPPPSGGGSAANRRRCSRCANRPPCTYRANCASSWGRRRRDEEGARTEGVTYVTDASSRSRQRCEISETRNWGARIQWARSSVKRGNIGGREPLSAVSDGDLRSWRRPLTMTYEPSGEAVCGYRCANSLIKIIIRSDF